MDDPTTIIGIDPGTLVSGYAVIKSNKKKMDLIAIGIIKLEKYKTPHKKLTVLFNKVYGLINQYEPNHFAIEAPFYAKNPQSLLKLGRAQGVAMAATMTRNLPVTEYSPKKVKQAITGNGNAAKEQVAAMLRQIFSSSPHLKEDLKLDATDALAVAVCHHFSLSNPLAGLGKSKDWASFIKNNPNRIKR